MYLVKKPRVCGTYVRIHQIDIQVGVDTIACTCTSSSCTHINLYQVRSIHNAGHIYGEYYLVGENPNPNTNHLPGVLKYQVQRLFATHEMGRGCCST